MREAFDVYQRFVQEAQQHGLLRPDVHQHLVVQRLVDAARIGQWTEQELWDAITAALATSEEQLKNLQQLVKSKHAGKSPSLPAIVAPSIKTEQSQAPVVNQGHSLAAAQRPVGRWLRLHRWRLLLAVIVSVGLYAAVRLSKKDAHPPPPPPTEVVEKPRPDSRYVKLPLPLPKDSAAPKPVEMPLKLWRPSVGISAAGGLGMFGMALLGLLLLRVWPHLRKQLQDLEAKRNAEKQEAEKQAKERLVKAQAKYRQLEEEAEEIGLSIRPDYRIKLEPPLPLTLLDDTATLLGRIYQVARSKKLDVKATLKRTIAAGGRPSPVMQPRRRAVELLVLCDEWDTRPYLPGFLKLLERWQKLGVQIERYSFQKNPQELQSVSKQQTTQLVDLLNLHADAPVILFASHLHIRGQDKYQDWDQQLHQTDLKVWLDPDPRLFAERDGVEQEAILQLSSQLPRFGLTAQGVQAMVRYLQQQGKGVQIPAWEPLQLGSQKEVSLKKWLACGVQVPDCSYEQFEAARQTFLAEELPDPRSVRLLVEWFQSEFGRDYRAHEDTVELGTERKKALKRWLRKEHPELAASWNQRLAEQLVIDESEDPQKPPNLAQLERRKREVMYRAGAQASLEAALQQLAALDDIDHLVDKEQCQREMYQEFDGVDPAKAKPEPAPKLDEPQVKKAQLFLTTAAWTTAAFALIAGLGTWTWLKRADWVGQKLQQPVHVKVEHIQDYKIEKTEGFPEVDYRPALLPIPLSGKPFLMGSPKTEQDRFDNEEQHEVELTYPFLMMETEVTQGQYESVMGENPSKVRQDSGGTDCKRFGVGKNFPVYCVDWFEAAAYANRLSEKEGLAKCYEVAHKSVKWPQKQDCKGYRLPTEAEWEYAARAGTTLVYAGSDKPEEVAWFGDDYDKGSTHEVKSQEKKPNAWGLHEMSGNVWEWVWDEYEPNKAEPSKNPVGPLLDGSRRVFRGGSWYDVARFVRVAYRFRLEPGIRSGSLGFRLVRSYP